MYTVRKTRKWSQIKGPVSGACVMGITEDEALWGESDKRTANAACIASVTDRTIDNMMNGKYLCHDASIFLLTVAFGYVTRPEWRAPSRHHHIQFKIFYDVHMIAPGLASRLKFLYLMILLTTLDQTRRIGDPVKRIRSTGVAWVIGIWDGLQFCCPQKSWDTWRRPINPSLSH